MKISQRAFDLIVREEVSSQEFYERHYTSPEWPGAASGITIGIGYDLGYASPAKIKADWERLVEPNMLLVMIRCSGVTGMAASFSLSEVKSAITIPWSSAMAVFANRDVPQWTAAVCNACPGASLMTPTCLGVLVSLAYNRGTGGFTFGSDRFTEMRMIRADIAAKQYDAIPDLIRSMERLWPNMKGLRDRREREAAMFESGINVIDLPAAVPDSPTVPDIPLDNRAARTKPPKTSKTQNGTAGSIIVAGGAAAQQAHAHGLISTEIAFFIGFLAVLAAITIWVTVFQHRNPPPMPIIIPPPSPPPPAPPAPPDPPPPAPPDPPLPRGFPRHL